MKTINVPYDNIKKVSTTGRCTCSVKDLGLVSTKPRFFFFNLNLHLLEKIGFKLGGFYLKLKSEYRNGAIYSYSNREVSRIVGCSPVLTKKYVQELKDLGLLKDHNGNLCFVSLGRVSNFASLHSSNFQILLSKKNTFVEYKDKCALLLITRKSSQQRYSAIKGKDSIKAIRDQNIGRNEINPENLAIGMRKMASYLNISVSTLCVLTKRLKKQGLNRFDVKTSIGKIEGDVYRDFIDRYSFKSKSGLLIVHYGSIYTFSKSIDHACVFLGS